MKQDFSKQRIYSLKVTILALVSLGLGIGLLFLAHNAPLNSALIWLTFWPIGEVGSILFGVGALGLAFEYFDGRDKEDRDDERVRRLLKEAAPEFRDAVVRGFAVQPDDLRRVATPELLDSIATNALALRLNDPGFAKAIYEDLRDQTIRQPERWEDVNVSIRLASLDVEAGGAPRFEVTVEWEYTVTPSHSVQRFACVSDRDEFNDLLNDSPATSAWFMTPRPGFNASERSAFELLQFSVNGEARSIRRTVRKTGQTYSASIGEDLVRAGKPLQIRHVYRTITAKSGHRLYVAIARPTRGLTLSLDYTNTDIAHLGVTDLISSAQRPRVSRLPQEVAAKVVSVEVPNWVLPQAGVTFVWTLESEVDSSTESLAGASPTYL